MEMTLASNIALRYACHKSKIIAAGLQPIHIEEPDNKPHSSQTGWIRRSWEEGLRQAGREQVRNILESEKLEGCIPSRPIVKIGDREDSLLEELRLGNYDLFIEGEISNFNTGEFRNKLRSRLYRKMPCPVLMVKNIVQSDKIVLLVDSRTDLENLVDRFCAFLREGEIDFDLCVYSLDDVSQEVQPEDIMARCKDLLQEHGRTPGRSFALLTAPETAGHSLREYGMLAASVDRRSSRKSPLIEVLARVSCPLLLCWTYSTGR